MIPCCINIRQSVSILNPAGKASCSCGQSIPVIDHYSVNDLGVWYNCDCGSTRMIPFNDLESEDKSVAAKVLSGCTE